MVDSNKKPDRIHYGFMSATTGRLLHAVQNVWDGHIELVDIEAGFPSMGEWTTSSLLDILYMYLMPSEYLEATNDGKDRKHPRPTYQGARPIAIYTKDLLGVRQREFSAPLIMPTLLKESGMQVHCTNVGVEDRRKICSVFLTSKPVVGQLYYSLGDLIRTGGMPGVYECIAPMGWEYLMLEVPEKYLLSKLLPPSTDSTIII